MRIQSFFIYICVSLTLLGYAGAAPAQDSVEVYIEEILEQVDSDQSAGQLEQWVQYLEDLSEHPVNVNRAEPVQVARLPGIDLYTANEIVEYRNEHGPFTTPEELLNVDRIDQKLLAVILPYVIAGTSGPPGRNWFRELFSGSGTTIYSRYQRTLEPRRGTVEGDYPGRPFRYYHRVRYQSEHLSVNLTQEKDPGEYSPNWYTHDYTSWHAGVSGIGLLRRAVAGDYSLSFGQGLVLWGGSGFGKTSEVTGRGVVKKARGIRPYSSSREGGYFRGVAAAAGRKFRVTGFYSDTYRDASQVSVDTARLSTGNGLHRTAAEMEKKNSLRQIAYGGNMNLSLPGGSVGLTGCRTEFGKVVGRGGGLYNRYDFEGRTNTTAGIDYKVRINKAKLFGETAAGRNRGVGMVHGISTPVGEGAELVLLYRNYAKDFQSLHGSGFGEQTGTPQNERGLYLGLEVPASRKVTVSAYYDQFWFDAPRFGVRQPSKGYEWLVTADAELSSALQFNVRLKSQVKEDEYETEDLFGRTMRLLGSNIRQTARSQVTYAADPGIRLRLRGEFVYSRPAGEGRQYGYLLFQDLRWRPGRHWKVEGRITVFETDGFESRVFQFENDLRYVFSIPALFGAGQRMYLLINVEPLPFLEVWAKISRTIYEDRQVISSGLNRIEGNKKTDVGVQVRVKF